MELHQYLQELKRPNHGKKMTAEEFADLLGIHKMYLSRLRRGAIRISEDVAERLEMLTNGDLKAVQLLKQTAWKKRQLKDFLKEKET